MTPTLPPVETLAEGFTAPDTIYRNVAVGHWSSVESAAPVDPVG